MHTYAAAHDTVFHYNSDFSGEVILQRQGTTLQIPATDLLDFVAYCYVMQQRIAHIEQMDRDALLLGERLPRSTT